MGTIIKGKQYSYKVKYLLKWTNESVSSEGSSGEKSMECGQYKPFAEKYSTLRTSFDFFKFDFNL